VRVSTYGQYGKEEYLGRPGYEAIAQAYGGMMNLTGDPAGPPQRAKTYTGDYVTALTGRTATMMALWEVKKSGRGQVIDLAQYEAVAQTNGNTLPLFTGEGAVYGHTGNRPPGFQPYDCSAAKPVASRSRILAVYAATSGGPITGTRFAVRGGSTRRCLGAAK
jgi:crotonobetainyl-CoA:carnitine CoA-transferase CaiB-like acyl-CoA transferase